MLHNQPNVKEFLFDEEDNGESFFPIDNKNDLELQYYSTAPAYQHHQHYYPQ